MKTPGMKPSKILSATLLIGAACLLLPLPDSTRAESDNRALFQLNGLDYMESELSSGAQLALYKLDKDYYKKLQDIIDEALFEMYLAREAARENKTPDEIEKDRLSVEEPGDDKVRALYGMLKDRIEKPYETVREQLATHLHEQQIALKKAGLLADYRKENEFMMMRSPPVVPFVEIETEGFPVRGNPEAKVTIVEFADYQCPHCKTASQLIKRLARRFEGKVKVVYMDRLVTHSPVSRLVAQGGVCAHKKGKFWEYHDLAYVRQAKLNTSSPMDLAGEVGLDRKEFEGCLKSEEAAAKVKAAEREAERLQINSTPTVFVNGKRVALHDIEQDIVEAIEKAVK